MNLPEVKGVDNQLEVKGDNPSAMSDAWILTKVKITLLFHRSGGTATEVDVIGIESVENLMTIE